MQERVSMTNISEPSTETTAPSLNAEASAGKPTPRINLSSLENIRLEMSRVYRSMRGGLIDTRDGSRLIYSLTSIGKILEAEEAAQQIRELTTIEVRQSSVLDGIDLGALSTEQLSALEVAVNMIDGIREGRPFKPEFLSKEDYAAVLKQALSEI